MRLPGKIVWTTIIKGEGGGVSCSEDISDSSVMIRPVHFYSIAIILNMIFKHEMLFLQSIEVS